MVPQQYCDRREPGTVGLRQRRRDFPLQWTGEGWVEGDTGETPPGHATEILGRIRDEFGRLWDTRFVANPGRFIRGGAATFWETASFCAICLIPHFRVRASASAPGLAPIMRTDVLFVKPLSVCLNHLLRRR